VSARDNFGRGDGLSSVWKEVALGVAGVRAVVPLTGTGLSVERRAAFGEGSRLLR